ncbi:MAG: SDR family oxidoreductase [Gammaproteobacteria bacterium]|jgi:7-alpha-hydroxysteroid dehydrogenase|nr:SDR family oxidoreductase [Gammaproteobacteria bacterium]MBT7371993.1 SDR family oxidoreductase [Gammaproteobacteria bacterium]
MTEEQQSLEKVGNRLLDQVVVVTGASRGLGRAIALACAQEGAKVVVAARTEQVWNEKLPGTVFETADEIEKIGGVALPLRCDVAVESDLIELVNTVHDRLGPIDVLVNNAALTVPGRPPKTDAPPAEPRAERKDKPRPARGPGGFLDFPLKGFRLHYEIGLFACYRLMQLVLPDMIAAGRGAVVNISSGASRNPGEGPYPDAKGTTGFAYGGNKAALEHLTRAVAYEMAPHGVAVNALLPAGAIMTPGVEVMLPGIEVNDSPENFAEAAVRLATADPNIMTGWVALHDEILYPERGRH